MSYEAIVLKTIKDRENSREPVTAIAQLFIVDENKYTSDEEQYRVHLRVRSEVMLLMTPLHVNNEKIQFIPIGNKYFYTYDTHRDDLRTMILDGFEKHINRPEFLSKFIEPEYLHQISIHFLHFRPLVHVTRNVHNFSIE